MTLESSTAFGRPDRAEGKWEARVFSRHLFHVRGQSVALLIICEAIINDKAVAFEGDLSVA